MGQGLGEIQLLLAQGEGEIRDESAHRPSGERPPPGSKAATSLHSELPRSPMRRALVFLLALPILAQQAAVAPHSVLQARFLSKEEAAKVLTSDDYFQRLQVAELRAKTGLELKDATPEQARSAAKAHYAAGTQDFNADEQALLRGVLDRAAPQITGKLPLMARTPFAFIKADAEGGLPHTRGACIILSPRLLDALLRAMQAGAQAKVDAFASSLLVHEQTHVLERQHPELFEHLFTEVF